MAILAPRQPPIQIEPSLRHRLARRVSWEKPSQPEPRMSRRMRCHWKILELKTRIRILEIDLEWWEGNADEGP